MGIVTQLRELASIRGKRSRDDMGAPDKVAAARKALDRLAKERAVAREAIAQVQEKRQGLLLSDAAADDIVALDRETAEHRLTLERLDAVEPELLGRLHDVLDAARRELLATLRARYADAAGEYLGQARIAFEKFQAALDVRREAIRMGFGSEIAALLAPIPAVTERSCFVSVDVLDRFEASLARGASMPGPAPKPRPIFGKKELAAAAAGGAPNDGRPRVAQIGGGTWPPGDPPPGGITPKPRIAQVGGGGLLPDENGKFILPKPNAPAVPEPEKAP
jgi:hypothetical protein